MVLRRHRIFMFFSAILPIINFVIFCYAIGRPLAGIHVAFNLESSVTPISCPVEMIYICNQPSHSFFIRTLSNSFKLKVNIYTWFNKNTLKSHRKFEIGIAVRRKSRKKYHPAYSTGESKFCYFKLFGFSVVLQLHLFKNWSKIQEFIQTISQFKARSKN